MRTEQSYEDGEEMMDKCPICRQSHGNLFCPTEERLKKRERITNEIRIENEKARLGVLVLEKIIGESLLR